MVVDGMLIARTMLTATVAIVAITLVDRTCGYHEIMRPLPDKSGTLNGQDVAVLLIPEVGVSHTDYISFGLMVQKMLPLRLYVCIVDISSEVTVNLDNLPILISDCISELHKSGMKPGSAQFLAAHGQLGQLAADYASAVPDTLRGLILLGAVMPKRFVVIAFPLPVLTLVGEIDGITRITRVSQTLHAMMRAVKFDPGLAVQSPIIVLEGSNHEVFINGSLPASLNALDIEAEVDKTVGMETASNLVSLFLARVMQEPDALTKEAELRFKTAFERAQNMTNPLELLREATIDNLKSYWVKSAQKWLSGLVGKQSTHIEVDSYVDQTSDYLPPTLITEQGISHIVTFSEVIRYADERGAEDSATLPQAPDEIAARMLGPERIQAHLKTTTIAYNYTCKDLNYASFMTAYHTASERARTRYDNYHRGVIFEPDIKTNSEALWESTRLKFSVHGSTLYVISIAYRTPYDEELGVDSGLFFCKLLPPDKAMEWIYVDSLRRDMPSPPTN